MSEEQEKLTRMTLYVEEEVLEELEEVAKEFSRDTGKNWSRGGVVRVALSEFFARRGKIL